MDQVEGVTVIGIGRVTAVPDVLRATVGVRVARPAVGQALDAANTAAAMLLETLRAGGVADRDLRTRDIQLAAEHRDRPDAPPAITGYTVRNMVVATLRDLDRVGELLSAAVEAAGEAARVEGAAFALEDDAAARAGARAAAFADAHAKAEHYADLAGRSLGRVVAVSEAAGPRIPIPLHAEPVGYQTLASRPVPLEPGGHEVTVTLTATWSWA